MCHNVSCYICVHVRCFDVCLLTRRYVYIGESVFVRLVGSIGFVNNWHGFGLGQQRSDLLRCADPRDAEQRLLRFLQSQGVDTATHFQPGALDKYLTGR
jgi:hypothetical protein